MAPTPRLQPDFAYLNNPARLEALYRLNIIDTRSEEVFDTITRLTATLFGVQVATIHLVDDHRQWVKASSNGTRAPDTPIGQTFCERTVAERSMVVIPDLQQDPVFRSSHFVTGPSSLRFYAGMPLVTRDNQVIGTLCLLDSRANLYESFSERDISLYHYLTDIVIRTMELRESHMSAQQRFLQASEEDGVTGLINSRGLLAHLSQQLTQNDGPEGVAGMIEIRLQDLERIRYAYGAVFANQLLQQVARRIQNALQPEDLLARNTDISFLATRVSVASTEQHARHLIITWAEEQARALLDALKEPFTHQGERLYLVAHLGLAYSTDSDTSGYAVLERADYAAIQARKESNVSAMCWSDPDQRKEYKRAVAIESRLRNTIEKQQLAVVFQPIVDLQGDNRIVGAEALVRWPQSGEPVIGPDIFVPLAEELGLIGQMGAWVFENACQTLKYWNDVCGQNLWMSLNVSPRQLQDPDLVSQLETLTSKAGLMPAQIKLEITESGLIEHYDQVAQLLESLSNVGFQLALDDFGTGHSSLSRLIHLPFNILKVDRAFVSDSPDGAGAAVVASLSGLARSLNLETVGEGVETDDQERFLRQLDYRYAQGYRYAKPLTAADFLEELIKQAHR